MDNSETCPWTEKNGHTYLLPSTKDSLKVVKEERSEIVALGDWPKDFREQFWAAYPRKVEKKAAMALLDRVRRRGEVRFTDLMAAVGRYAAQKIDLQYTKGPTVWLNRGCWDDHLNNERTEAVRSTEEVHALIRAEQERLSSGKG